MEAVACLLAEDSRLGGCRGDSEFEGAVDYCSVWEALLEDWTLLLLPTWDEEAELDLDDFPAVKPAMTIGEAHESIEKSFKNVCKRNDFKAATL